MSDTQSNFLGLTDTNNTHRGSATGILPSTRQNCAKNQLNLNGNITRKLTHCDMVQGVVGFNLMMGFIFLFRDGTGSCQISGPEFFYLEV